MWPSLETASRIANWANIFFIASLVVGVVSTVLIWWMSTVKESHWDDFRRQSNETIAQTNARASEAELKLEQLRRQVGPRQLQRDIFIRELSGQPAARVEILYLQDDPECFDLAQQIWRALEDAKWPVDPPPRPIPPAPASNAPTPMSVGGQPSGVTVVAKGITHAEEEASTDALFGREWVKTPWTVLVHALGDSLGKIGGHAGGPNSPPAETLRVVVAPRS